MTRRVAEMCCLLQALVTALDDDAEAREHAKGRDSLFSEVSVLVQALQVVHNEEQSDQARTKMDTNATPVATAEQSGAAEEAWRELGWIENACALPCKRAKDANASPVCIRVDEGDAWNFHLLPRLSAFVPFVETLTTTLLGDAAKIVLRCLSTHMIGIELAQAVYEEQKWWYGEVMSPRVAVERFLVSLVKDVAPTLSLSVASAFTE
jgi:hypothetical protein